MSHEVFRRTQELLKESVSHKKLVFSEISGSNLTESNVKLSPANFPKLRILGESEVPSKTDPGSTSSGRMGQLRRDSRLIQHGHPWSVRIDGYLIELATSSDK